MKSIQELEVEFANLREVLQAEYKHKEYYTPYTGDLILDFSKFTDDQSGKKSDDPDDPAAKDSPNIPAVDGHYYHTIRDVTWATYHSLFPNRPVQYFYTLSDEERAVCINKYIQHGKYCSKDSINILCAYFAWGSWDYQPEISLYKSWYNSDAYIDAGTKEHDVFVRLVDIRRYRYSVMNGHEKYYDGWTLGILNFYALFKKYIKL